MMDKLEDPKTKYDELSSKTFMCFVFVSFSWKFNFIQATMASYMCIENFGNE
jgi:hypothetical protein